MATATNLQHVQQRRFTGIVETEEKELGMLVGETQGREDIPDCVSRRSVMSIFRSTTTIGKHRCWKDTYTS